MFRLAFVCSFFTAVQILSVSVVSGDEPAQASPEDVFEQRIMPIFKSPKPASCIQCHLAGVDLKEYILPSHEQTFASLRDQRMIDLTAPKKSKILKLIDMGAKDTDRGARLIHEKTRQAEYDAFEKWITACCNDPKLKALPPLKLDTLAKPKRSDEVIRHARKSRVIDSFERNLWSQRMRSFPCLSPHEIDPNNPRHKIAQQKHNKFLTQNNGAFKDRMVLFKETPGATVQYLIERSRTAEENNELPLLNLKDPAHSLLLLKPTSKLPPKRNDGTLADPSYNIPVSHLGGLKMHVDDQSYKAFIAWIQDYSRVVGDEYTSVEELPADNWYPTKHAIILRDVPESWPDGVRVQFFIHSWDKSESNWSDKPVAFTQTQLAPRRTAAGLLFRFGPAEVHPKPAHNPPETPQLPPGKYRIKLYIDRKGRLKTDPTLFLSEEDFAGELTIQARWGIGFPQAERVSAEGLK